MQQSIHERFSRDETVALSSDRSFGTVMTAAFAVISILGWWRGGHSWRWIGGIAVLFLMATLLYPVALNPLNRLWFKISLLLNKVMNPIVMALVFFGAVAPSGLVMRLLGRDQLRLKRQPNANSYWIERRPPGPAPESMKDQF
jgi:hypothetical protein